MSPEAPQGGPAAGGRAPSFGAPTKKEAWAFTLSGSIYASEAVGIGKTPETPAPNQVSGPLHVPVLGDGKVPYGNNVGGSLSMTYGNSVVSGVVNAVFNSSGKEYQGYYSATSGPVLGAAYITVTPQPLGPLQLQIRVGGFTENFAGPGQWGWGIYGPLLATRGYGFSAVAQYAYSDRVLLSAQVGLQGVPGVPESFVRGNYTGWLETGVSSLVMHGHVGVVYENKYTARLHVAHNIGYDEREYLIRRPLDGSMDAYILETRYVAQPFGQLGVSLGLWDFKNANHVHDGIWWGLDWTKGGSDMLRDYVGLANVVPTGICNQPIDPVTMQAEPGGAVPCLRDGTDGMEILEGNGTGKLMAISAEWDTSIAAHLWAPRPFNGQGPDVRLALAGVAHWTLDTADPSFDGANGFLLGAEIDYQMLSWFSATLRSYGEDRDFQFGRYQAYSVSPGIAFRSNWQSNNRIELIYSRRFYSSAVDRNPARPLDPHVLALGAYINF